MGCGEQQVALSQHPQHSLPSGGFRLFLFSARTHSREKDSQWRCVAFFGPPLSPPLAYRSRTSRGKDPSGGGMLV